MFTYPTIIFQTKQHLKEAQNHENPKEIRLYAICKAYTSLDSFPYFYNQILDDETLLAHITELEKNVCVDFSDLTEITSNEFLKQIKQNIDSAKDIKTICHVRKKHIGQAYALIRRTSFIVTTEKEKKDLYYLSLEVQTIYANLLRETGEHDEAIKLLKSLEMKILQDDTSKNYRIPLLRQIGTCYFRLSRYKEAKQCYNKALSLLKLNPNQPLEMVIKSNLVTLYKSQGIYNKATTLLETEIIPFYKKIDQQHYLAANLNTLANIFLAHKNYSKARAKYIETLQVYKKIDLKYGIATCNYNLARLALEEQRLPLAQDYLAKALELDEAIDNKELIAQINCTFAIIHKMQQKYYSGLPYLKKAKDIYCGLKNKRGLAKVYHLYFDFLEAQKLLDVQDAFNLLSKIKNIAYNLQSVILFEQYLKAKIRYCKFNEQYELLHTLENQLENLKEDFFE